MSIEWGQVSINKTSNRGEFYEGGGLETKSNNSITIQLFPNLMYDNKDGKIPPN